jgi:transcription antitermination factor NusG
MFRWYVINTYSGHENKVKQNLEHRVTSLNQSRAVRQVVVPTETVQEMKDNQKISVEKRTMPGYVLVNMDLNEDSWQVVKGTPGVTGFVGASNEPVPLTQPEVDRLLHRGKYNTDGNVEAKNVWTWKNLFNATVGITNEYPLGDRIIAWSVFLYSFGLGFVLFLVIVAWNTICAWPGSWWGNYYLIRSLMIPGVIAVVTTVWFFIGGVVDLRRMFRDLKNRQTDDLDNGMVSGNVSLSDKKKFEAIAEAENER